MTTGLRSGVSNDGAVQVNATDIIALTTTGAAAATGKTLEATSGPSSSAFGFRNKIINGGCQIKQRAAVTITNTPTYGGVDRFMFSNSGTGITATSAGAANTGWKSGQVLQLNGSWTSGATTVSQRIEASNCFGLGGSATAQARIYHTFGGATDFTLALFKPASADTAPYSTQVGSTITVSVPNAAATVISGTFTVPTADASLGLELRISHTANTASGVALLIGDIQLEPGSVATPFEARDVGDVLRQCQRYYYREYPGTNKTFSGLGYSTTTTNTYNRTQFPVPLRVAPSAVEQSGTASDYNVTNYATSVVCSAVPGFSEATLYSATTTFTTASGMTAGVPAQGRTNNTTAYLGWSAEL